MGQHSLCSATAQPCTLLTLDVISFQHLITRAKKRESEDKGGGIIADEMGLGKTLVMLATMICSQARAWSFFRQQTNIQRTTEWVTKGTLVIAPSPR